MTDDASNRPDDAAPSASLPSEQPAERARRSRRRGRRGKSRSGEARTPEQQHATEAPAAPEIAPPVAPAPRPQPPRHQPAPHRTHFQPFQDGYDRFVCPEALRFLSQTYPVQHRKGLATVSMIEVDRRDSELLVCNGLHLGACLWPDGELVGRTAPEPSIDETAAADDDAQIAAADHPAAEDVDSGEPEQIATETVTEQPVEPEPIFDER